MSCVVLLLLFALFSSSSIADEEVTKDVENIGASCWVHISPGCIRGQNMKRYRKKSVQQCKQLCLNNTECAAFEYGVKHTGKSRIYRAGDCQLNRKVDKRKCSGGTHDLDLYIYQKECLEGLHPGISQSCVALQVVGLLVFFAVFLRIITGKQCATRCTCCRRTPLVEEPECANGDDNNSTKELVCGTNNYAIGDDFYVQVNDTDEKFVPKDEDVNIEEENSEKGSIYTI